MKTLGWLIGLAHFWTFVLVLFGLVWWDGEYERLRLDDDPDMLGTLAEFHVSFSVKKCELCLMLFFASYLESSRHGCFR